jgi:hypothetical protein
MCGGGILATTVQCQLALSGTIVDDVYCNAAEKPATEQVCNTQICLTYQYIYYSWGTCVSATACGSGTQTRNFKCIATNNPLVAVAESNCINAGLIREAISRPCEDAPCTVKSTVGTCSVTCIRNKNKQQLNWCIDF